MYHNLQPHLNIISSTSTTTCNADKQGNTDTVSRNENGKYIIKIVRVSVIEKEVMLKSQDKITAALH